MSLADDTTNYIHDPIPAEDVEPDSEVALPGVDHLVRITDTDVTADGIRFSFEDEAGESVTVTVPGDQPIEVYTFDPIRARARAIAMAAPPPSPELVERLRVLLAPAVEAWWAKHDAEAAAREAEEQRGKHSAA